MCKNIYQFFQVLFSKRMYIRRKYNKKKHAIEIKEIKEQSFLHHCFLDDCSMDVRLLRIRASCRTRIVLRVQGWRARRSHPKLAAVRRQPRTEKGMRIGESNKATSIGERVENHKRRGRKTMHESRNKMQPEISLGTPGLEERVIITDGAALFSTRWLVRRDQRGWTVAAISAGWNVLYFFNASTR